ncbi:HK97-gp10 family putative phage morphogenesis protein [Pseudogemmobacter sonorensis]|uniref:HK97-gp10 family putative phage morphogenesis protein n=1 Tax=Pseudogemmobacter sonorensis TaxID=2989681 RepID=UPI0036A501F7
MTIKTTGFRDLDRALAEIEKTATRKAVMRRALIKSAQPMADRAGSLAPVAPVNGGELAASVAVSTKLSARQRRLHRRMHKNDKAAVEVFVGAGPLSSAHNQEFGNENHGAQPFMRPAWDAEAKPTLERVGKKMWFEIDKQAKRAARKAARDAKKAGG